MERAKGVFIKGDHVELKAIEGIGFPVAKFEENTGRYLYVDLFEVPVDGVRGPLDSLEGYTEGSTWNHYNRREIKTLSGEIVSIYEINRDITDRKEEFFSHEEGDKLFYNWR